MFGSGGEARFAWRKPASFPHRAEEAGRRDSVGGHDAAASQNAARAAAIVVTGVASILDLLV